MEQPLTLDGLLFDLGIANDVAPVKPRPLALAREKSPRQAFIDAVQKQLDAAKECSIKHKIEEVEGPRGKVLKIADPDALAAPHRGKPPYWFTWKNNQIVVFTYHGNSALFPAIAFSSWEPVIKYLGGLIYAANSGKLDQNIDEIERRRKEKRAANRSKKFEAKA